jgi:phosphodiesterase/alkaline phosphatase D-like protein
MRRISAAILGMTVVLAMTNMVLAVSIDFGPYCGAVTDSSAVVLYKLDRSGSDCRLVLSTDSSLSNPVRSEARTSSSDKANIVKLAVRSLEPLTRYYYGVEIDGELLSEGRGTFKTFPATAHNFTFAFGNSLRDNSPDMSESGLAAAVENDIAFFLCTGDLFYDDIGINDVDVFRRAYRTALRRGPDALMGRSVPFVYIWDDHDYGPNNSDAAAPGRTASRRAYREAIPHYPLPAGEGDQPIYQAFSVGTVRFIITDLRSERDDNWDRDNVGKSMMGQAQRQWFLDELLKASTSHDLVFWVSSVPYTAGARKGKDHWGGFSTERKTIANFIRENGIENLMVISGDAHCVAAGDGSDSDYADGGGAPLAEILAAPLDNGSTSVKGGPWSQGTWRAPSGKNAYGLVTVEFEADRVTVRYSGRDNTHDEHITLSKHFDREGYVDLDPKHMRRARQTALFTVLPQGGGVISLSSHGEWRQPLTIEVFTAGGQLVQQLSLAPGSKEIARFAPGVYSFRWRGRDNMVQRTRVRVW